MPYIGKSPDLNASVDTNELADDAVTLGKIGEDVKTAISGSFVAKADKSAITGSFVAKADKSAISGSVVSGVSGSSISTGSFGRVEVAGNLSVTGTGAGGGLVLINTTTASSVSSVVWTSGIDGTYGVYKLIGYDIVPEDDDKILYLRVSDDGGSTYKTSGYTTSLTRNLDGNHAGAYPNDCLFYLNSVGNTSADAAAFDCTIYNPSSSTRQTICTVLGQCYYNSIFYSHYGAGQYDDTAAIDALQIVFQSDAAFSGVFKLYGLYGS